MTRKHQCRIQLAASEPVAYRLVSTALSLTFSSTILLCCLIRVLFYLFISPSWLQPFTVGS